MKINDILAEGFWSSMAKGMGANELSSAMDAYNASKVVNNPVSPKAKTQATTLPDPIPQSPGVKPELALVPKDQTNTGPLPRDGKRIKVIDPRSKGVYYKTGPNWTNEVGQGIVSPGTVDYLEKLADAHFTEEPIPAAAHPAPKLTRTEKFEKARLERAAKPGATPRKRPSATESLTAGIQWKVIK